MSETIRYARIGEEDLNLGKGTFEVRLADGRVVTLNQIDIGALLNDQTLSSPVQAASLALYETGSWTPTVGGTATYTTQTGYYTKIGNVITVMCELVINAIGTGSTSGLSGTLPYPVKTGTVFTTAVSFSGLLTAVTNVVAHGIPSGTIQLRSSSAVGAGLLVQAILGNGSTIRFSGSYLTD